jgi:phosphoserine/homoserine phosphotransferase
MILACLDLEGVLFPEIWINVAEKTNIPDLRLTTRDISNYDELMKYRLKILKEKKIKLNDIKEVINTLRPLDGAKEFFIKLKEKFQIIILSDTFYQFAMPLMKQLDYPTIFCHNLLIDDDGYIKDYKLRINDAKRNSVLKFKDLNFKIIACGDSYNDIAMLKSADRGILFKPPQNVVDEFKEFTVAFDYNKLWELFLQSEKELLKNEF